MITKAKSGYVVALLLVTACGMGGGGDWSGTVRDSAGIAIVENTTTGMWTDETRPTYTEELRIGTASGDVAYQFGAITGLDVGTDGLIYVLDQQARMVRVYDEAGEHVRDVGGPGSGPGELGQVLVGLMLGPDNTVLVPDMMQQRVNRYTPDGEALSDFRTSFEDGIPMRWEQTPGRLIVQQSRRMTFPGQPRTGEQPQTSEPPRDLLFVRDVDGTMLDTMLVFESGGTFSMGTDRMEIRLFEPEPVWAIGLDGTLYFGRNHEFNIEVRSTGFTGDRSAAIEPQHETEASTAESSIQSYVRMPVERRPVTDEDQAAFRDMMRELFELQGLPAQMAEQMLSMVQFAEFYPAFANLMGGPANTLWVQRVRTAQDAAASGETFNPQEGDSGSPTWDVFDTEGRYLGPIELPSKFTPLHVVGNEIWGVGRDDLDVQYVVKLRLSGLGDA